MGTERRALRRLWALTVLAVAVVSQTVLAQSSASVAVPARTLEKVASTACTAPTRHVPGGPDGTGTCWPGPNNTGVPVGTTLTDYTGPCTISTPNTVIDGKTINCSVDIRASNVTIKNSKVNGTVILDVDVPGSNGWSFTLQDSEVDGGQVQLSAVGWGNLAVIRSNIHGGQNAVQCEVNSVSCVVRDSYLHGQYIPPTGNWHLDGFLSDGGRNMTLRHNFVVCDAPVNLIGEGCTGNVAFIPNFAPIDGALIEHNLLGANVGSSYCTYGGEKPSSPTPNSFNVRYRDNVFQRGSNGKCGAFGPVTGFSPTNTGNEWIGNTWEDGRIVNADGSTGGRAPARDTDGDGLSDEAELRRYETDPRRVDTDRDGLSDGLEVRRYHTDPRRIDTDRDSLDDRAEVRRFHTDPRRRDTDRDGLDDGAEVRRYHTSPLKPDSDGDGVNDRAELRAGTNPRDRNSRPA